MANSIAQIQASILATAASEPDLAALNSPGSRSLKRLWAYVVAVAIWSVELLFDWRDAEVDTKLAQGRAHRAPWYREKALAYQHGYALVADEDYYDNSGLTAAQVDAARVVKHAAVTEGDRGMRLKVAGMATGELVAMPEAQLTAFKAYMNRVKDAGVTRRQLVITSGPADSLKLSYVIYYDPLVLDASGARLDGTDATPVQSAIDAFLRAMPFNGALVTAQLTDRLQAVPGVVIPHLVAAQARYGVLPYESVSVEYAPDAGYLRILSPADLTLQFIPREPV